MKKTRDVYVIGVGMTKFARHPDRNFISLGEEAMRAALADAGIGYEAIETAFCGHVMQGGTAGQKILDKIGRTGIPIANVENACASGTTAFRSAWASVAFGMNDVALALGFEKMGRGPIKMSLGEETPPENQPPMMPFIFARIFEEHSALYGTTREQMALVSVKNHDNGALNPRAQYQKPVTIEEVLNSREIVGPLTLLMCCPTGAGAAAAIVCTEDVARTVKAEPIRIVASAFQSEKHADPDHPLTGITEINQRTANLAYEMAGLKPDDIDVIELHDCFAIAEIIHYENLGLCKRGEGGKFIEEGMPKLGGKVAVSPSGGLLSKGHPLGATGVAQVFEIVTQLRGKADQRQVKGAKIGLTHCQGFGGATGVHIFAKE
ncbi:MAG: thiolase family protein [Candidatus Abyssobacteria bacterium SURF_17]|uniref:Thiolase family protein n=1 Tax=Candidatus Abyssobacteria bacterium SURF_17 TaxID=2093361 RepID=A0A419EQL0_9BACT|nr:MAG: thiolase family protein [Candidatus Abyssubacteria bacterium SURF_17]